jgi:LCP family protein required for cell wall assembly
MRIVRRVLLVAGATVVAVALGTSALVAAWLAGARIPIASGRTYLKVEKFAVADTADTPDGVFYMLLVGSDFRPGVGGARGDAIHVVGVNPELKAATIINIPRDTCWNGGKINRAHAQGGPRGQADAAGQLLGVNIAYAVSVDFAGFTALVDGVGGVTVDVPTAMDDHYSGAVFSPGPVHMNGSQALSFSRDRHDFPQGDITRTQNQGLLIWSALGELQKRAKGAAGEFKVLATLGRHAQLEGIGLADLYRLGRIAFTIDPKSVKNVTVPTGGGGCMPLGAGADTLLADFRDDGVLQSH